MTCSIGALDSNARTADFDCGEKALDEYLQRYASQDMKRGVARVFVASPVAGCCHVHTLRVRARVTPQCPCTTFHAAYSVVDDLAELARFRVCVARFWRDFRNRVSSHREHGAHSRIKAQEREPATNPGWIDGGKQDLADSFDRFEAVFRELNEFL